MRAVMLVLGLMVAVPAAGQTHKSKKPVAAAPVLKPFEFRGFVAGVPLTPEQAAGCESTRSGLMCSGEDDRVAGVRVMSVAVWAANNKLSSVHVLADPIYFEVLTSAFRTKYGRPCRSTIPIWVGEMGNRRPNPTITWCFLSGKLVAKMYSERLDVSEIDYTDINQPKLPQAKPTVDF